MTKSARHIPVVLACAALALSQLATAAAAQDLLWLHQFGTTEYDASNATASDGAGGIYFGGETYGNLGSGTGILGEPWIARYDGTGTQIWLDQFGASRNEDLSAMAPDGSGGVFSGGRTDGAFGAPHAGLSDAWIGRHDAAGNLLWLRQIGTPTYDYVVSMASDDQGGVYVAGVTYGSLGGPRIGLYDYWLARYDGSGNAYWIIQQGTAESDFIQGVGADGAGGVFVCGFTRGAMAGTSSGAEDAFVARIAGDGSTTWVRQFGTPGWDGAIGVASDGADGLFVGGLTDGILGGSTAGTFDAWVAHHDGAGTQRWIRQFGSSRYDDLKHLVYDRRGGALLCGYTQGDLGAPVRGSRDAWISRFDAFGHRTWLSQFGATGADLAFGVSPDGAGGAYLCGRTDGYLVAPQAGINDAWLARMEGLDAVRYCSPAAIHSGGVAATINVGGSDHVMSNEFTLFVDDLPEATFGYFLLSETQGFFPNLSGSEGNLCLGGSIGRFNGPGQVMNSGVERALSQTVDLTALPGNTAPFGVLAGETWNFQAWFRDANPASTSNFSDAIAVTFRG